MRLGRPRQRSSCLGDIDAPRPLHIELEKIRELTEIFWIPGNHDSDDNSAWNNLVASELGDLICIAGLRRLDPGGLPASVVYSGRKIWRPPDEPRFASYDDLACRSDRSSSATGLGH